jgi:diaminopimelate epimerase
MAAQPQAISFHKMHSLGNDFMVFDAVSQNLALDTDQITTWSDRNRGIGFDQLLVIEPPTVPEADFYFRIYNADGTEAEQCGNGTRCVAALARQLALTKKHELVWQSLAGIFRTTVSTNNQIGTEMTVPVLDHADIPFQPEASGDGPTETSANGSRSESTICESGERFQITPVSMGNPHAVLFVDDIFDAPVDTIGARLTRHPSFPEGANVGFCQVVDRQFVRLRVYERGVGETLACGTGACAAVVAARLHDRVDERVKVSMPGGKLWIAWSGPGSAVTMSGSATHVYQGELPHVS